MAGKGHQSAELIIPIGNGYRFGNNDRRNERVLCEIAWAERVEAFVGSLILKEVVKWSQARRKDNRQVEAANRIPPLKIHLVRLPSTFLAIKYYR